MPSSVHILPFALVFGKPPNEAPTGLLISYRTGRYVPFFEESGTFEVYFRFALFSGAYRSIPVIPGNTGRDAGTVNLVRDFAEC